MADYRASVQAALPWAAPLLTVATLAWIVCALGLGLEATDESYYLLSAIHADSIELFFTPFHWVAGPMWRASGGLLAFRAMGLVLCAGSAVLLAWAVLRAAQRANLAVPLDQGGRIGVLSTTASGALLYGSLLSFTPSYNLLAAGWSRVAVALGLLAILSRRALASIAALAAGAALALSTLAKFPAGIGTAVLIVVFWIALATRREAARLPLLLVGALATIAALVTANGGANEALAQFRAGVEVIWSAQRDHTTFGRLARSASDVTQMVEATLAAFWGPLACVAAAALLRSTWMGLIGIAWFAMVLATGGYLAGGYDRFTLQAQPLTALLLATVIGKARDLAGGLRSATLLVGLVLLPLAIAIGTSNPLQVQMLAALAPWGVVVGVLGLSQPWRWPSVFASLLFGLTGLAQVVGHADQPYRLRPLSKQIESVALPDLGPLRVDRETAAMARAVQDAVAHCAIPPGAPFIDLYDLPVAGLLVQGRPLVSPWMLDADYAALVLRRADPALVRRATLALKLDAQGQRPTLPAQLAQFPRGWRLCGGGIAPLDGMRFEIWSPTS